MLKCILPYWLNNEIGSFVMAANDMHSDTMKGL